MCARIHGISVQLVVVYWRNCELYKRRIKAARRFSPDFKISFRVVNIRLSGICCRKILLRIGLIIIILIEPSAIKGPYEDKF